MVRSVNAETVLVEETFSDGNRSGFMPPKSLEWFCSVNGRFLACETGKMVVTGAMETARHAVARFAEADKPVTLEKGESLILTFEVKPVAGGIPSGNSLRFGFFNSANDASNIFSADGQNHTGSNALGYVGAVLIKSDAASSLAILKREGEGALLTNSHAYKNLQSAPASIGLRFGESYDVELRIKRTTSDSAQIDVSVQGAAGKFDASYEDSVAPIFTFDTVGFSIFKSITDAEFSNIKIIKLP